MIPNRSPVVGGVLRFLALAVIVTAALIAAGYAPTRRIGGPEAIPAMLAGCLISMLGSVIGALPIVLATRGSARSVPQAILLSTTVRFVVVLVLTLSAALSGWFDRPPLLVWIAISYVVLLVIDTICAVKLGASAETTEKR